MIRPTLLFSIVLAIAGLIPASSAAAPPSSAAPEKRYIVVLKERVDEPGKVARQHERRHRADVDLVYRHALLGYAATIPDRRVDEVRDDSRVAFVERDQRVEAFAQEIPTGVERSFADQNPSVDIDASDDLRVDVDLAVIDTGVDYDHPDLNVVARADCTGGGPVSTSCAESSGDDGNGHGTHVAGSAAAIDDGAGVVGMAPGARLWAVKVLGNDGSGWISWIVAGIDYVTNNASKVEVANMSLGCACSSDSLDQAVTNSVKAGVVHAVAAGNDDEDTAAFSPANHPDVITVSALADFDGEPAGLGSPTCEADRDDTLADFSNWGSLVDLAAPGVCIASTWKDGGYKTISGTSMASPHAAGTAALLASGQNDPQSKADVEAIRQTLIAEGNLGWTDDSGDGILEPLLDVSDSTTFAPATVAGSGGGETTNAAPTAGFSFSCTDLACDFDGSASSDSDGSLSSYRWDFGDGTTGTGATVSHAYAGEGTYPVTLTVTDDDGATDTESKSVSVSSGEPSSNVKGYDPVDYVRGGTVYNGNGAVSRLYSDDGERVEIIAAKDGNIYTSWILPYAVITADERSKLDRLTIDYDGHATGANTYLSVAIYNFSTEKFELIEETRQGVTSDQAIRWSDASSPTEYVSSDGAIAVVVVGTRDRSFRTKTDLVSFEIEY